MCRPAGAGASVSSLAGISGRHWQRPLQFCALGHAMFNMWLQSPLELIPCLVSGYIKLRVALRLHRQDETGADFDFNQVRVAEDCGAWEAERGIFLVQNKAKEYKVKCTTLPALSDRLKQDYLENTLLDFGWWKASRCLSNREDGQ